MKKERRQYYRQLQNSFSEEQYRLWNQQLASALLAVAKGLSGKVVAVYQPRPKEADLSCLFSLPLQFCFPKILSLDGKMEFRAVKKVLPRAFMVGPYGILEPKEDCPVVEKGQIEVCFVPLLAFDGGGRRLGQGKGFYDRFLAGFKGQKIGVGFQWQFSPAPLPVEETDQVLHSVVTEHGWKKF